MMKRAGQLFDVLLAVLVVNKVFAMACTPAKPEKPSQTEVKTTNPDEAKQTESAEKTNPD